MKKVIILLILGIFILLDRDIERMKLTSKRDEYKKAIEETRKNNDNLKKKRDKLKMADYDTIRKEAIKIGLTKKGEKVIRFYQAK